MSYSRSRLALVLCATVLSLAAASIARAEDGAPNRAPAADGGAIPMATSTPKATPMPAPTATPAALLAAKPTATPSPTPKATPTPAPSPTATPGVLLPAKPTATPAPTATPKQSSAPVKKTDDLTKNCAIHFPGRIQGELRQACVSSGLKFTTAEKGLQQTKCRLSYGEEPRAVMACLIGVTIADDLNNNRTDFKRKVELCGEQYPQHTEIDAFLQESCLTGIHLPELLPQLSHEPYDSCAQLSAERSFIGPCAVGLSLVNESASNKGPNEQNILCEKYFDHKKFHLTYRACLNARSVTVEDAKRVEDVIKDCANIVSDPGNDNERAACLIGSNIHRSLEKKQDVSKGFAKCGTNKVTYEDRDILACLTAASLIDMVGKNSAENGCKTVFKEAKGSSRGDCLSSLSKTF